VLAQSHHNIHQHPSRDASNTVSVADIKCGSTGQRRLGSVRALRLLAAFTSKDTSIMFGPHTEGV
jgi:hypothetical protein